jgi:metallo-beta-lactamase family protein
MLIKPQLTVQFLGAAGEVTGSKFLLSHGKDQVMVDCGMFQGLKELRLLNWEDLPVNVSQISNVILTHGHLDHVGYLPRLVKQGFSGNIIGSLPTLSIAEIILLDSAKIHEEEAEKANKESYSKHNPALPLYTVKDAEKTIKHFKHVAVNEWNELNNTMSFRLQYNGHILGATFVEIEVADKTLVFSGDIGRKNDLLLSDPQQPEKADYLFIESTYGNKLHPTEDLKEILKHHVNKTIYNRGILIIPSFAVERLQSLMYLFWWLFKRNEIPDIPIFIDSPMGHDVLKLFKLYPHWHKIDEATFKAMCAHFNIITSYRDTWKTIDDPQPKVVIAGSGMVTGGRVLTYLQQKLDMHNTTVLLVGYQAEGTRGRALLEGTHELKIFGKYIPVKAEIAHIDSLSAHADQGELLQWMDKLENPPKKVFLIHGESSALDAFRVKIESTLGYKVLIPKLGEIFELE